ncbi:hypothetical protein IV54_GL000787 [Levilactobacillus paucivorans]|uniref:Integral membrane protein n=1 Tax=Levilactobacillus paucivorans TaxID=616990 RepID=A0A0R2M369_9LACO|nr:hypothetical protein [Levilactobacillus paucivorans]KRO04762.1 hypothetical protein IV54_GL000787 [Levilactobacillus paucivorans]
MQKLYRYVPMLSALTSLYFLWLMSMMPTTTDLDLELTWRPRDLWLVATILVVIGVTALAKHRRTKEWGLAINGCLVIGMAIDLWQTQRSPLMADFLWLWAILMMLDLGLIVWGGYRLWWRHR